MKRGGGDADGAAFVGGGLYKRLPLEAGEELIQQSRAVCRPSSYQQGKLYLTNRRLIWVGLRVPLPELKGVSISLDEIVACSLRGSRTRGRQLDLRLRQGDWYSFEIGMQWYVFVRANLLESPMPLPGSGDRTAEWFTLVREMTGVGELTPEMENEARRRGARAFVHVMMIWLLVTPLLVVAHLVTPMPVPILVVFGVYTAIAFGVVLFWRVGGKRRFWADR